MDDFGHLEVPLTIYVDEAGGGDFGPPKPGHPKRSYAIVAVAVPTLHYRDLFKIIPRDSSGKPMKSTHREMSPELAVRFADDLIRSPAHVGAFLLDPGHPANVELAECEYQEECRARQEARDAEETMEGKRRHPAISRRDYFYLRFVPWALQACARSCLDRTGYPPTFLDIVLDTQDIHESHRQRFVRIYRETFDHPDGEHSRIHVNELTWKTEQEEPLLLLPDLFGGILGRADRGLPGADDAAGKLWDAEKLGRFCFFNTPPGEN